MEVGNTSSALTTTLAPGSYTVEATTYSVGATGDFTLTVTPAAPCLGLLTADGTVSGIGAAVPAQDCAVGMVLAAGQECSGDEFSAAMEASGELVLRFTGATARPDGLELSCSGGGWRVDGLS